MSDLDILGYKHKLIFCVTLTFKLLMLLKSLESSWILLNYFGFFCFSYLKPLTFIHYIHFI